MKIVDVGLKFGNMTWGNRPKEKIVHHLEAEGSNWSVANIHNMHVTENGWAGIGYHYYIRLDGTIYKGRPDEAIGSHCKGANTNSIGIAFEGDYDKRLVMPKAQYNSWCELSDYLDSKYGSMPTYGHRERGSSECPGKNFPLDEVKQGKISTVTVDGVWKVDDTGWWFEMNSDHSYPRDCWCKLQTSNSSTEMGWYHFNEKGYMDTQWIQLKGEWYYLGDDGKARQNEWYRSSDGKWYYFNDNCEMLSNEWLKYKDEWYYFLENGEMATGWIKYKDKDYLCYSNGVMARNCEYLGYRFDNDGVATKI